MSQLRQNLISKDWVLIAPNRSKRPNEFAGPEVIRTDLPEVDLSCPFCPGNENENIEISRVPKGADWEVRVIPNKFEALAHIPLSMKHDFYMHRAGSGDHEVLITRKHNEPIALQSVQTIALTMQVIRKRLHELGKLDYVAYAQMFHNYGFVAGASITHPHYQILATPLVPPMIHDEISGAYDYYRIHQSNVYEDMIHEERMQNERVIMETERFIVLAPYASKHPFESMILPKGDSARFEDSSDEELSELGAVLKAMMSKMYEGLNNPPINFFLHTMPFVRTKTLAHDAKAYRWHISLFPRLVVWAGFEFGTGIPVNPVSPEEAASFLQ